MHTTKAESVWKKVDCIFMCTKSGNHGKLLMSLISYGCVFVCVCSSDVSVGRRVITMLPHNQLRYYEGWHIYTCSAHQLNHSPTRSLFASSVQLHEFYRWSISFARDLHRFPIVNTSKLYQYNQQLFACTTCSSFSHETAQFLFRSFFWGHTAIIACNHIQTRLAPMMYT